MTENIFHGDKIYLNQGAMAFKPLGMETVLESIDEKGPKKKVRTDATKYGKGARLHPTTEQNIAL